MNLDEHIIKDILVSKLPHLEARITKINEKLKSGGMPLIEFVNHGAHNRLMDLQGRGKVTLPMVTVSISRSTPSPTAQRVQVLAKTTLDPNLTSKLMLHKTYGALSPDEREIITDPEKSGRLPGGCDHCSSNRNRSYIFTLKTPGGVMRIGGGCLKAFVGFDLSRWTNYLNEAIQEVEKYSEVTFKEISENEIIPLRVFIAIANTLVTRDGYRSRDMGYSTGSEAYALAQAAVESGAKREDPEDTQAVDEILTFIKTSIHREQDAHNDYFMNLRTMVDVNYMTSKQANLLASAPQSYKRHLQDIARKEEERRRQEGTDHIGRNFVGKIKDRKLFEDLTVVYVRPDFDERFGASTKICMVDSVGNYFTWKASGSIEIEANEVVQVLGTITKHETYYSKTYGREINDNKISRCQFLTPEEVLETRKKLEKIEARAKKSIGQGDPSP